jgi:hypothetical protein
VGRVGEQSSVMEVQTILEGERVYVCSVTFTKYVFRFFYFSLFVRVYYMTNDLLFANLFLKVPKREIFDHSDFHNFYAIKSLTVSDFGVKIKICLKNI